MDELELEPIPPVQIWPNSNQRLVLGAGAPITREDRLSTFSPKEFETFVNQWASAFLNKKYSSVQMRRGAGDKGRDVVGFKKQLPDGQKPWDNFQCKHYKNSLAPADVYVELGKLCYYTFKRTFSIPDSYTFVCNNGVGTKLADLIDEPKELREQLIANWDSYCLSQITRKEKVQLVGEFLAYVQNFDFGIVTWIPPLQLLDEHAETEYHPLVFGTQLKPRPKPKVPPRSIAGKEHRYVEQLCEAYSDHASQPIRSHADLVDKSHWEEFLDNYHESRKCFYSAESLKEFARDNLPKQEDYFAELTERIFTGIKPNYWQAHSSGYARLLSVTDKASSISIGAHILDSDLLPADRIGICHQLANTDKIKWVKK